MTAQTATIDMTDTNAKSGVKRREFLKVLGAGTAAVSAAACSEPTGKLIPYLVCRLLLEKKKNTYYANVRDEYITESGVLAETRDDSDIKLESDTDHTKSM